MHPYLSAFFTNGIFSKRVKWFFKYFRWVKLVADSSLALTDFEVHNAQGEVVQLD